VSDPTPALGLAAGGSATVAFVLADGDGIGLHVTSTRGPLGPWERQSTYIARVSSCRQECRRDWEVTPVLTVSPRLTAIVVPGPYRMLALTRSAPGGAWTKPVALQPADATNAYLSSAHVRQGTVRALATCAMPPCHGTAVLRTTTGAARILGRVRFAIRTPITASARIRLPRWAQARLAHGGHLRTQLEFTVHERDGTSERTLLTIHLHT
jgi:hypothetical protein